MLATEIYTHRIPEVYSQFSHAVGDGVWKKRVYRCRQEIKGNEFLKDYLREENDLAFQFEHLRLISEQYGYVPLAETRNRNIYPAVAFATQVLSIMASVETSEADKICRRVRGAFSNPDDMRGLRLELAAATHFSRIGRHVSWPETTGIGTFDLLVEKERQPSLEVECKSIGKDKGRRIHRREIIDFCLILKPYLKSTTTGLQRGLSVVVTIPDRLPRGHRERVDFAKVLGQAIFAGKNCCLPDGSTVRIDDFDISALGNLPNLSERERRTLIDKVSSTSNRSAIFIGTPVGGLLALTIQSTRDDMLFPYTFDTLSDAAKRQLTGSRAGMLFVCFEGLSADQLLSIAGQDQDPSQKPTYLRVAVSKFLSSKERAHLVGTGFVSASVLRPEAHGVVESAGVSYYFPKQESPFWHDAFSGMFNWAR